MEHPPVAAVPRAPVAAVPRAPVAAVPRAPIAERRPESTVVQGHERIDDYAWLKQRDNPDIRAYLEAENAYTEAVMAPTSGFCDDLYKEMLARIQETDVGAPAKDGPYLYYIRTQEGKQYAIHCRKPAPDGPEEVVFDENARAEGHDYYALGVFGNTEDHNLLAYGEDTTGAESYTLRVKDLRTGEVLPDELTGVYYGFAWANDGASFYYTVHDEAMRPHRLYLHRLGTPQSDDVLVFEEPDERFFLSVSKTRSKRFIFINLGSMTTNEAWFADAATGTTNISVVLPREQDIEYSVTQQGDRFLITINDQGRNFRLVEAPIGDASRDNWRELVPHRDDVMIEGCSSFADHVIRYEREAGLARIVVMKVSSGDEHIIEMPEPVYGVWPGANYEFDTPTLRFAYTSLSTPMSHFDYDMDTRERTLVKQQPVLGDFDPANYATERVWADAEDGVKVPVSLVYRKGLVKDGTDPCWLYAYGSYGASIDPYFDRTRLALLDRGIVFAIAHIRGGGELGKTWHDAGRMAFKRNTFTDFVACAEHLIAAGFTSPDKLVIEGGSAGGLLMGAVVNMRPDLFFAAIAHVPFVDCVNTILDPTLPLTVIEYEEWGNPAESEEVYRYMLSYSPYDNVEAKDYPHMLVTTGMNDPRVNYWEPAKWVAKLRALKTDDNRLLLKTHLDTGHGGPSGRYDALRQEAFNYTFALDLLGLT